MMTTINSFSMTHKQLHATQYHCNKWDATYKHRTIGSCSTTPKIFVQIATHK